MTDTRDARSIYLGLLASAEGVAGKTEVALALARAAWSRMRRGRGALHVRRPVVIASGGIRWWVPPFDNSFASTTPGRDNGRVLPALTELLAERPQPVCLDIGANLGFVCMPLARRFPARRIVAVEPVPWLADALVRTARLNGFAGVTVVAKAIAGAATLELAVPVLAGVHFTTLSTGLERAEGEIAATQSTRVEVPALTLDALLDEVGAGPEQVACVKIDVEGAEALALSTGPRALSARPPVVFEALSSAKRAEVETALRGLGYARFDTIDTTDFLARE